MRIEYFFHQRLWVCVCACLSTCVSVLWICVREGARSILNPWEKWESLTLPDMRVRLDRNSIPSLIPPSLTPSPLPCYIRNCLVLILGQRRNTPGCNEERTGCFESSGLKDIIKILCIQTESWGEIVSLFVNASMYLIGCVTSHIETHTDVHCSSKIWLSWGVDRELGLGLSWGVDRKLGLGLAISTSLRETLFLTLLTHFGSIL